MSKITLPTITNGQDLTTLNSNFQSIATQLNTNVLYRTNIGSEPDTMSQDLDFNGHAAYNLSDVLVNGVSVLGLTTAAQTAVTNATNAANAAQAAATTAAGSASASVVSANAAAASAITAASAASTSGSLIAANNLSDVPNKTTARSNLVLGNIDNTSDANKPVSTAQQTALNLKANLASPTFTGVPIAPTAGATTNTSQIATTGFAQNLFANPQFGYGSTTPNTVAATTITATGLITPTSGIGIKGTAAADNTQAGSIGEYVASTSVASPQTSGVTQSVGQISLTPGDWDVTVVGAFSPSVSLAGVFLGSGSTLNALGPLGSYMNMAWPAAVGAVTLVSPTVRYSLASTTTIFPQGNVTFTSGTCTFQSVIRARRVR